MEYNDFENAQSILEKLLKRKFSDDTFTSENKKFLVLYSVLKKSDSPNTILYKIEANIGEQAYYNKYPQVKRANEEIRTIHKRFDSLCKRDSNAFKGFMGFFEWWCDKMDEQGEHYCYYCGVKESDSNAAFKSKKIQSKKFTGGLQIERKDSNGKYNYSNCEFACVLCNNAKSDMITENDFKEYFSDATKAFWEHIANEN